MNKFLKKILLFSLGGVMMAGSIAAAHSIRTPEGNMPMVHWAVLEATPGNLGEMGKIGANTVAKETAKESGTYALYGAVDVKNHDLMRLLEIYESYEAYRIHSTSLGFQEYRAARFPMLKGLKILEANGIALEQKESGTATVAFLHRYEVKPEKLLEYQRLATAEAIRAVAEDDGVMGMFVTAEHDNPNIIHTMELFRDKAGYERYMSSAKAKEFQSKISSMFLNAKEIENLPANIPLSAKGLRK